MNCFQLIKSVLDEAYEQISGDGAAKDAAIKKALEKLSQDYHKLLNKGCLDYNDPVRRFAYMYRYTTSHANLVYDRIRHTPKLASLFERQSLHISCVGGGPGSDFLGVLKYCLESNKKPDIKCMLTDRDPAWGESWSDVDEKVKAAMPLSTVFNSFDVTVPEKWKTFTKHYRADLFMLIYFLSEVYAKRDDADVYFQELFARAKPGAFVLFIDNNSSQFYGWFDQLAAAHGFNVLDKGEEVAKMPPEEEKTDLEPYFTKFADPKLKANIAWRVVKKEMCV